MPLRLVMDTTILVSAVRSRNGAAAEVLRLVLQQTFSLLMDYNLSCEYRDVVTRPHHTSSSHLTPSEILSILSRLEDLAQAVEFVKRERPLSVDPDDDRILELAIAGRAGYIVTNNLRHLREPAARFGILAITPRDLLDTIRRGDADAVSGSADVR